MPQRRLKITIEEVAFMNTDEYEALYRSMCRRHLRGRRARARLVEARSALRSAIAAGNPDVIDRAITLYDDAHNGMACVREDVTGQIAYAKGRERGAAEQLTPLLVRVAPRRFR